MSVTTRQHSVERLTKTQAGFQEDASQQRKKIATPTKAIGDLERSSVRTTSASTRASKARRIEAKNKELSRAEEKLADIKDQQAKSLGQLNQAQVLEPEVEAGATDVDGGLTCSVDCPVIDSRDQGVERVVHLRKDRLLTGRPWALWRPAARSFG